MSFKDISYLELWRPHCSVERNHLCNFGNRHHKEQFCELILSLDQRFRKRCRLETFLIKNSGSPLVQRSEIILTMLVKGIMGNISVKLVLILNRGSGGDVI